MNRTITLAAALCLALTVSACGQTPPANNASANASAGAVTSEVPQESVSETGRERQTTLSMELEGQTEEVPATLYEGEGYSIYIPDEGWTKTAGKLPKGACDQWVSELNPEVTLTVCRDETEANWVESQTCGIICDQKSETGDVFRRWTVYLAYPDEAAEGFGTRLQAVAGTFALTA